MSALIQFSRVTFEYDSTPVPLFRNLNLTFPVGWTGIVGANATGKSSLLKLVVGELAPSSGKIIRSGLTVHCEQHCDILPEAAFAFLDSTHPVAIRLRTILGTDASYLDRWKTLSMGERRKIQRGTALHIEPDILCIDEPTNHFDLPAIRCLEGALKNVPSPQSVTISPFSNTSAPSIGISIMGFSRFHNGTLERSRDSKVFILKGLLLLRRHRWNR